MNQNAFESKLLKQINSIDRIDEGLGSTILNFLFGNKFKKELKKAAEAVDEASPEFKAALLDFEYHVQRLRDMQKRHKTLRRVAKGYK
jgi:hypothetical protein